MNATGHQDPAAQTSVGTTPLETSTRATSAGTHNNRRSVRTRLMGIVLVGAALAGVVGIAGIDGESSVSSARAADVLVTDVQLDLARLAGDRSDMGAAITEAVLAHEADAHIDPVETRAEFESAANAMQSHFTAAVSRGLRGSLQADLWAQWPGLTQYIGAGRSLLADAATDPTHAASKLDAFDITTAQSTALMSRFTDQLERASTTAERRASAAEVSARVEIVAIDIAAILLLFVMAWGLGRFIVRALQGVGATAAAITSGDLDARTTITGDDEIGGLGRALNEMADSLRGLFARLGDDARRDAFRSQLSEAFEIADTVSLAYTQTEMAMREISTDLPMELLLADSSRANMEQLAVHPTAGAPGCPVRTPYECVAVRRGTAAVFDSSEALNACPKLRDRPGGPCSAACVPVTFMGRALGVLHVTGVEGSPPTPHQVGHLSALAAQAGTTIGTVRATESTVRQATTDGLTGLINRRALENELRRLVESGREFAVAMADLDHFKAINDTYGHAAGDRALRVYAQTALAHVRSGDVVGRYGGEEFVLLFPDATATSVRETVERLRSELASAQTESGSPRFTASYGLTDSRAGTTVDELLQIADDALAEAKQSGRDRVVTSDGSVTGRR
jgi:diguanylate cyclase (GGDEF)-like protein